MPDYKIAEPDEQGSSLHPDITTWVNLINDKIRTTHRDELVKISFSLSQTPSRAVRDEVAFVYGKKWNVLWVHEANGGYTAKLVAK